MYFRINEPDSGSRQVIGNTTDTHAAIPFGGVHISELPDAVVKGRKNGPWKGNTLRKKKKEITNTGWPYHSTVIKSGS